MRLKNVHIGLLMLIFSSFSLFAQEEKSVRGELSFLYSHIIGGKSIGLGGFGADFHSTIPPMARFATENEIWAKQPLLNVGLEGNLLLAPLYTSESIIVSPTLSYSLRYSHERYQIHYDLKNASTNGNTIGNIGGPKSQEDITLHALTNHLNVGIRVDSAQSSLYTNLTVGVLFYNPIGLKWVRQAFDKDDNPTQNITHSVGLGQSKLITDSANISGTHILSLSGTSEILFNLGARLGYGPLFMGINYATNVRVSVISVDVGLTFHPFVRSNN